MVKKKFARIGSCFLTMALVATSTFCMGTFSASAAYSDTEPAGSGGATAVLNNEAGWSTCNVYYWGNSGNNTNAGWPGVKLTDSDKNAEGFYEVQIPSTYLAGSNGVIFNNGSEQSADLTIAEGDCKVYNNKTKSWTDYDSSQLKLSLSTDVASPQYKGTAITLTANASGGSGSLTYTFKAGTTTLYTGANNTTVWTPSAAGTYNLSVDVADGSGNTNSKSVTYEIKDDSTAEEPILKGISTGMTDNQGVINTAVPITVNAAGGNVGTKLLFYKIAITDPSGNAVNTVYYRQSKTLEFTPTTLGNYSANVTVQNSYNATVTREFTIKVVQSGDVDYKNPVVSAFTANPTSGTVNSAVTLSTTVQAGTGEPNFTYTYQVNGTTVATKTASSRSNSYSWTPSAEGTYKLAVTVRDSKGNTASKTISSYTVNPVTTNAPVISSATVSADTAKVNDTVAIKTVIKSGTGTPNFKYTVKVNDTAVVTAKDVSSRSYTYNWTPTTAGTYKIEVVVNDADGNRASKVISSTFKVTGDSSTVIESFTIAKTRVGVGETVALTTKVKAGTGQPDFRYVIKANDERLYSFTTADRTYTYNWTPMAKGTFNFTVVVFDASGKNVQATVKNVKVVTNPTPIIESVTADKSSANVGDTVAITTKVLAGTGTAPFKYTVRINDYSVKTSKINSKTYTYNWQPTQAGTYKIEMFVYNSDGTLARKVLDKAYVVSGYTAPVISSATLSKSSANVGDTVAIKTTVKAGTGSPNFKYTIKVNDSTVVTAKDISSRSYTYNWKPTAAGTYKIEVVVNDSNSGRASKVISSTYKVTKSSYKLGDINNDGVINDTDSAYLMGYLGGDTANYPINAGTNTFKAADIDADGQITINDAILLSGMY
ncbi:MAG: starch-binding protein [Clostridia bacterium]|nr:starch-binding protein [Clostridia bacterium]